MCGVRAATFFMTFFPMSISQTDIVNLFAKEFGQVYAKSDLSNTEVIQSNLYIAKLIIPQDLFVIKKFR